ncbi:class I SAM-dependent DNA methyltransferase [Clostridium psychrophilum]|uniref:class I SAM-dependent DNA methyltransferase n=1 Tax=Clostridium psychrophilum TaxID=132926 RepID=UPI001C0A9CB8|nr:DNA methyltransferase [Clostridium psychrophilum]MBU3181167.1 hypothetical protein [Clostridium psychrophilum]
MSLSFNNIKQRAIEFSYKWKDCSSERSEAQSFWNDFFNVFDISRKRVATFEKPVRKNGSKIGYIDLFWKSTLVVEHKSKGKSLDKAYSQAIDYFEGLSDDELPKYVIVSDFQNFRIYDLEKDGIFTQFTLENFYMHIYLFSFITGYKKITFKDDAIVNIQAGELLGKLYISLKDNNFNEHDLSLLLIRILFCLFADHTGIWAKNHLQYYILQNTKEDGSDLGLHLNLIFETLNTDYSNRQSNLHEDLQCFRYINGGLYKERLSTAIFTKNSRSLLLNCCSYDWSQISPVIFGSIFQSAMSSFKRQQLGIHYTSERDTLKVIEPLILNDLRLKFNNNLHSLNKLNELLKETSKLRILDPACGCGNFLILTYREIRLLQIDILKQIALLNGKYFNEYHIQQQIIGWNGIILDVDSMYGFEIDELAVRISQVALWLIDHQLNSLMALEFGIPYERLPLKKIANIFNVNALKIDWNTYVDKKNLSFIVGNPPYLPSNNRSDKQRSDMDLVFNKNEYNFKNYKRLDYVCAWYVKASSYIKGTSIKVGYVSTNSITQGEQVELLWEPLLAQGININFAHRSFKWKNGLSNDASVYVCVIGFAYSNDVLKKLYDYDTPTSEPLMKICNNINPYLLDKPNIIVKSRTKPINKLIMPLASKGSMPNDGGNLILNNDEKVEFCLKYPESSKYIRPFISAYTMIRNIPRWCIWLENFDLIEIKKNPFLYDRIQKVFEYRKNDSKSKRALSYPYLFENIKQPSCNYIVIPSHTSVNRIYIPIQICDKDSIVNNSCIAVHSNDSYILGVLMSSMHMAWIKEFSGRLKGDYRYSIKLCYNTFPFIIPSEKQREDITNCVSDILKIRSNSKHSLAQLYDAHLISKELLLAHKRLDTVVEKLYLKKGPFVDDRKRINVLLTHYFNLLSQAEPDKLKLI